MRKTTENGENVNKKRGRRLAECREAAGLSQFQLAERIHVTKQTISNYETGARNLPEWQAVTIGKELAVDPDYLLCKQDHKCAALFPPGSLEGRPQMPPKSLVLHDLLQLVPSCHRAEYVYGQEFIKGNDSDYLLKAKMNDGKGICLTTKDQIRILDELLKYFEFLLWQESFDPFAAADIDLIDRSDTESHDGGEEA